MLSEKSTLIQMRVHFAEYIPAQHDQGFNLTQAKAVEFESPLLSESCTYKSAFGFLNGSDGQGGNLISFALQGKGCAEFISNLYKQHLSVVFYDVPAIRPDTPNCSSLRMELMDLP